MKVIATLCCHDVASCRLDGSLRYRLTRLFKDVVALLMLTLTVSPALAQQIPLIRVGVLNFGTVNWELAVVAEHRLAQARDVQLEVVPLASENALAVALQGGRVDLIVSDWLWVMHQRKAGRAYQFAPYSLAVGAVMVAPQSGIGNLESLAGRKLGIAGGPFDKTWLLLRAYAREMAELDLAQAVEPTYAAPPMINRLMQTGELPAAVNFWHYNAQLEAQGMRPLFTVEQMLTGLGIDIAPPLLGWIFDARWAAEHREALQRFLHATYDAKALLADSDAAWEFLRERIKPQNDAMFEAIKAGYRAGIPHRYGDAEIDAAQRLLAILAEEGGDGFVPGSMLDREIFWDGFRLP